MASVLEREVLRAIEEFFASGLGNANCPRFCPDTFLLGNLLDLPALLRLIAFLEERFDFRLGSDVLRAEDFATPARIAALVASQASEADDDQPPVEDRRAA